MYNCLVQSQDRISRLKQKIENVQETIKREKVMQVEQVNAQFEFLKEQLEQDIESRAKVLNSFSSDVFFPSYKRSINWKAILKNMLTTIHY